jgi:4-hydroxybenzoate polyprenyltransferase
MIRLAFDVSRYRFWLYLGGTYFTGYIIGATKLDDFLSLELWYHLLYFMIPANIFLYGINDLFDRDTDQFNIKKETKEVRIRKQEVKDLRTILLITQLFSLVALFIQENWTQRSIFLAFIFLSYAYSSPPFRFKAKPILDFSSNILYALPGIFGYYQITSQFPPLLIIGALFLWTGAMHLFSAIPDIDADAKAGVTTTAVYVGRTISLWTCFVFWFIFIFITVIIYQAYTPLSYIAFLYPVIPLLLLFGKRLDIEKIYWLYPYINGLLGFGVSVLAGRQLLIDLFSVLI